MQVSSQYPPGTIRYVDIRDNGIIILKTYTGERREYREVNNGERRESLGLENDIAQDIIRP